jgi:diguanylate cyclase (GGDEF)-like protein
LWARFGESFGARVSVLEEAAVAVLSDDLAPDLRARAEREAHKLAGSLGTFGIPRGSEVAREIESWFQRGGDAEPGDILRLAEMVAALRGCVDAGPAPSSASSPWSGESDSPFLLVVDDDPAWVHGLGREASARGLRVVVANDIAAAQRLLETRPEAVLIDPTGAQADHAFGLMRGLQATRPPIPVVVLTRTDTFTDRVEAARLGGRGFLRMPITPSEVLGAVAEVIDRARASEASVLAVDDDPAVLGALTALLGQDGQRVVTLDDPMSFWETLRETSPDLVILDVDMPHVNGVELCQVMRADPLWSRTPVVFLTARTDPATVQAIFAAGADDYVAKPLVGPELTARIANRMERSRLLRRMAETDALTGVANQRTSAEAMKRLLDMGERFEEPVAMAMVDVDRLQSVNDRFGYASGDEVLGRLGRLLLRAFPGDDAVGRWAGQEFFVCMFGMTRGDGVQRLAEALEELRRDRFPDYEGGSFGVSFSAGVAQFPDDGADLRALYRGADGAVRRAKEAGGDRVVPVGWSIGADSTADVVVVEDDEALAGLLLYGLSTRAYRTQRFDDGQDAASALQGPSPKLTARVVLLDWGLPSLDGLRVLRRLADTGVLRRTRVIMLTARDSESEVLQALELGAFDHVAKPFSVPVLMKRVHRAMEW